MTSYMYLLGLKRPSPVSQAVKRAVRERYQACCHCGSTERLEVDRILNEPIAIAEHGYAKPR